MNTTIAAELYYTAGEKVGLSFVVLPCAILSFILLKFSRRPLLGRETIDSRMIYAYSAISGGILGQFFFHSLPNGTIQASLGENYSTMSIFVFLGLYIMLCIQKYTRVSTEAEYYTAPQGTQTEVHHSIDPDTMTENTYYRAVDLEKTVDDNGTTEFARDTFILMDENKEKKRRRLFALLFYTIMLFENILSGFLLVFHKESQSIALLIIMFWLSKMLQTFIVCVVLIHAMLHAKSERKSMYKWRYVTLMTLWCLTCLMAVLPVLTDLSISNAVEFLDNPGTSVVYSMAGGVLFWIALYFMWIDRRHTNKRETILRLVLFAATGVCSYVSGIFI